MACHNLGRRVLMVPVRPSILVAVLTLFALPTAVHAQAPAETIEYYATDAIGSIRVVFGANGAVLGRQDYGPFGRELLPALALPVERFGGQEKDAETEQGYFHARQYQHRTGRFTRVDPIYAGLFEPQRLNRYSYALNNPLAYIDPQGLWPSGFCQEFSGYCNPLDVIDYTRAGPGGSGGGGFGNDSGRGGSGRDSETDEKTSETTETDTTDTAETNAEGTNPLKEFVKGCGQGLAGFVDGVIPFADPLQSAGAYGPQDPAAWFSQDIGSGVRDFAIVEYSAAAMLTGGARALYAMAKSGKRGSGFARTLSSNNRYVRLGMSRMGSGGSPTLRFGNSKTDFGRWESHWDLRLNQTFSPFVRSGVKNLKRCLQ